MSNASLGGVPMRINPHTISWPYSVKTSATRTIGGIVLQVFGVDVGDMTVVGSFGVGGWREQKVMHDRMKTWADQQGIQPNGGTPSGPIRFMLPSHGYDFMVRLKDFSQVGAGSSIEWSNQTPAPQWQLVLFIEQDNINLKKAAVDQYINRLREGLGWKINQYNGPDIGPDTAQPGSAGSAGSTGSAGGYRKT